MSLPARTAAVLPGDPAGTDTLSDLLRAVRLTGAVFFDFEAAAPWAEMQPPGPTIAHGVLPGVQHLISYHAVTAGSCFGGLVDGERGDELSRNDSQQSSN